MKGIFNWLDQRTGYRDFIKDALFESVPGGSRWRYVWGSTLTFAIVMQFITGIMLWMFYSASSQTAWESVYYIQEEVTGGWILRGIHHWTAQVMTVLLLLHLLQVIIDGAYRAPREINFWFGMGLLGITLAMSLTGYLLPWDQKGYWATKVATNLMGGVPFIGDALQRIVVGGVDYGHHTLTRFFALHAGVLPFLLIGLIAGHIYLFRRHGIKVKQPKKGPDVYFWPDQVLKDAVACLAVLAVVLVFVFWQHGAHLSAPANPAEQFSAARPDWYFMFLFQLLKYFPGDQVILGIAAPIWGSVIVPGALFGAFMLLPFVGAMKWRLPIIKCRLGDFFAVSFLIACIIGFMLLTYVALDHDWNDPHFAVAVEQAEKDAARVKALVKENDGIPPEGALALLRNDPLTQGPRLFKSNCSSCHTFGGEDGLGAIVEETSAADLKGFASREWLTQFLSPDHIGTAKYWGNTAFVQPEEGDKVSKMVTYVMDDVAEFGDVEKSMLDELIIGLSAEAKLPAQEAADAAAAETIAKLPELIGEDGLACTDCHHFQGEGKRPDLTGYGSREWMREFIKDPSHKRFYGERNDRMPSYGPIEGKAAKLSDREVDLIVDWLRR
ncbi:MAG: ubiquinol-cytochrome c reductase cytochrome b subunit [Verrucomicrobiales bacterium]|jgi:ubiquinol-cytochrome c reductase cytochrome b subunit